MDAASARIYREGVSWRMILSENRLPLFRIMRSSPCGGTGRRARLKIVFRKEWGFDSLHGHHPECCMHAVASNSFLSSATRLADEDDDEIRYRATSAAS